MFSSSLLVVGDGIKTNVEKRLGAIHEHTQKLFRFGLIQITRQRVRPEMSIKTNEPNPNVNGEVEAPIVLIDKINTELSKITKNKSNTKEKIWS